MNQKIKIDFDVKIKEILKTSPSFYTEERIIKDVVNFIVNNKGKITRGFVDKQGVHYYTPFDKTYFYDYHKPYSFVIAVKGENHFTLFSRDYDARFYPSTHWKTVETEIII